MTGTDTALLLYRAQGRQSAVGGGARPSRRRLVFFSQVVSGATASTTRLVRLALLVSMALIIWVVELHIPVPLAVPGAKLGLANVVILYTLVTFGLRDALVVNLLRVVLGSLLTGTFLNVSFLLALSGGVASTLVMGLAHALGQRQLSVVGISLAGAFTHNLAQVLAAIALVGHPGVLGYLPYLLLFALPTGFFVGMVVVVLGRSGAEPTPRPTGEVMPAVDPASESERGE